MKPSWQPREIEFVLNQYKKGYSYKDIRYNVNSVFKKDRTLTSIERLIRRSKVETRVNKSIWTTPEITFVLKCVARGDTYSSICKQIKSTFNKVRTESAIEHIMARNSSNTLKYNPRVLIVDIETKPMTARVWGLFDQNIALNQLVDEGGIFSWSAKWIGESEVLYKDVKGNMSKEKQLLTPLWKLMDQADIIIGQNSNKFDIKKLNSKFLEYKLGSPSRYKKVDTLVIAKRHFAFVSNKLEWMSKKFCKLKKLAHSKFPGFMLWDECGKGNPAAWKEMELYNKMDVLATEELFVVLSEFEKNQVVTDAMRSYNAAKKGKK